MFFVHLLKAVIVAIFYCIYLGCLVSAARKSTDDEAKQAGIIIGIFIKHIICAATLNIMFDLVGFIDFSSTNVLICMTALMILDVEDD